AHHGKRPSPPTIEPSTLAMTARGLLTASSPPTVTARCSAVAHARPLHAARDGTYQAATLLHCRLNLGTLPRVSPCRRNGSCRKEPANAPFAPRRSGPRRYGAPSAGAGSEPPTARSGTAATPSGASPASRLRW